MQSVTEPALKTVYYSFISNIQKKLTYRHQKQIRLCLEPGVRIYGKWARGDFKGVMEMFENGGLVMAAPPYKFSETWNCKLTVGEFYGMLI